MTNYFNQRRVSALRFFSNYIDCVNVLIPFSLYRECRAFIFLHSPLWRQICRQFPPRFAPFCLALPPVPASLYRQFLRCLRSPFLSHIWDKRQHCPFQGDTIARSLSRHYRSPPFISQRSHRRFFCVGSPMGGLPPSLSSHRPLSRQLSTIYVHTT